MAKKKSNKINKKKLLSEIMSALGKRSHKKSPRTKEQYIDMAKKRWPKK